MQPDDDKTRTHITLTKGTMVSHYRIIEKIGSGGMGEVYLAEDTELNRQVALKFLPLHLCQDADCRARFKREAQAAAKLDHPNIVTVYEVGEHQGRPFFAMQHIEEQSLIEVPWCKQLPIERILEIGIQVCDALQAAHDKGITHRDIKPSNILIDSHGRARIVDFGLASVLGTEQLTKTGSTLGTVGYMSPEQVRGDKVDHRTDLFSLGVVMYEMIAGRAPFKADSEAATLHAITHDSPQPLARFHSEVPDDLQRTVSKLLEKNPALRYQTASDVIADLKRLAVMGQVQTGPSPRRTRKGRPVIAAAALFAVLIGVVIVFKFFPPGGKQAVNHKKMLAVLPFENLGAPEDEYFADGITEEITSRLAAISGLGVISRTSSMQYKKTAKSLRQIGKELGADYVLEGTIRWDKTGDTARVRITPQLINVARDMHLWAENYERVVHQIFAVQADIAEKVAAGLDVALLGAEKASMAARPTSNVEAYEYYLRGIDQCRRGWTEQNYRAAAEMFAKAVELDPGFAVAYTRISMVHSSLAWLAGDPGELPKARAAVDRAFALQPDLPEAHLALGEYYYRASRDYDRALEEFDIARKGLPNNSDLLAKTAFVQRRQGRFDEAFTNLKLAAELDPVNIDLPYDLGLTGYYLRKYDESERFLDRAIALSPGLSRSHILKVWLYISWLGDIGKAQGVLAGIPEKGDTIGLIGTWVWLDLLGGDYHGALTRLARPVGFTYDPEYGGADTIGYLLTKARLYSYLNQPEPAVVYYDSARAYLEPLVESNPKNGSYHGWLGMAYAGLHRKSDAIREAKRGVELLPLSNDAVDGAAPLIYLAVVYVMVGEYDAAIDELDHLLSIPSPISIAFLRLEPRLLPLRSHPRFQKLLEKYGS